MTRDGGAADEAARRDDETPEQTEAISMERKC